MKDWVFIFMIGFCERWGIWVALVDEKCEEVDELLLSLEGLR